MDALTAFGLFAVTAMLVCYALEGRSHWFVLAFAGSCALGSAYGFLQGAWPFGVVEAIWAVVALRRWQIQNQNRPLNFKNRPVPSSEVSRALDIGRPG
jgi:hypothetical protein